MIKNITPLFFLVFSICFSFQLSAQSQCFKVDCPATPKTLCDFTDNDPLLWNAAEWLDPSIQSHDLAETEDDLSISVTDTCGSQLSATFVLYFDLDGNGAPETTVSSKDLGTYPAGAVPFNNFPNPANVEWLRFDGRPLPDENLYRFTLETTTGASTVHYRIRWNTTGEPDKYLPVQMPYGLRLIKWIIEDQNGYAVWCSDYAGLGDCKKPVVACINGLSVNLMPTKLVTLWVSDFLQYTTDNYTPQSQIEIGVRKSGTGSGFPVDPNGMPSQSVTFACDELGTRGVELWARDQAGNTDYCETYVIVQDNLGVCSANGIPVTLCLDNCGMAWLPFNVSFNGNHPALPSVHLSNLDVHYINECSDLALQGIPFLGNYTLTPNLDAYQLNGVSAYDLIRIQQHIDSTQLLDSPYKMIAADANNSRSLSSADLVELSKLILGVYTELPNNTSWRFVDKDYIFPDSLNPFSAIFPESVPINPFDTLRFEAIKVGDVSCNIASDTIPVPYLQEDLLKGADFCLGIPKAVLHPGDTLLLPVTAGQDAQLSGWQFDLRLGNFIKVIDLIPAPGLKTEHFAVFNAAGFISGCWYRGAPVDWSNGEVLFYLKVVALQETSTEADFSIKSNRIWSEAYNASGQYQPFTLCFKETIGVQDAESLPSVWFQPNPAGYLVRLVAPAGSDWELFDMTGRVMMRGRMSADAVEISLLALPVGVYGYRVRVGEEIVSGKLVKQ